MYNRGKFNISSIATKPHTTSSGIIARNHTKYCIAKVLFFKKLKSSINFKN